MGSDISGPIQLPVHGKTHPAIFSIEDFVASSPQSITLRPMTSWIRGLTRSDARFGPPMANTSFPSTAMGLPPNTGAARKSACFSFSFATVSPTVSGWTVEQSTKILSFSDWFDSVTLETRFCRTASLEIFRCQYI